MASEPVSQNEVDALFTPTAAAQKSSDVHAYDFRRPNLISKERLRSLQVMYGTYCKSLESWLTTRVRGTVDVHVSGVEQLSFGEFTTSLPNPTAAFVFDVAGSGQQVVIDFGRDFAFYLVERLLGSSGEPPVPERALTVVERMVVRIAADFAAAQLSAVWKDYAPLDLTLNRFESLPEILRTANREDPMLVATIGIQASHLKGTLQLCVPFAALEKFFTAPSTQRLQTAGRTPQRNADRLAAETMLRVTDVHVTVRSPSFPIALRDVAALTPGRTLATGLPPAMNLIVRVEGDARFIAQPGRVGRMLAARITDVMGAAASGSAENLERSNLMATVLQSEAGGGAPIDLAELGDGTAANGAGSLSHLFHVTLPVTIELGRARMRIQEVLELGRGSVISLDRLVGEPVDVIIGDRRFAEGEVVVIGEQFGVRITRILSTQAENGAQP